MARITVVQETYKKRNQLNEQCMAQNDEMHKWSEKQLHGQKCPLLVSDANQCANHYLHKVFEIEK
jgi:hypothetical protein